MPPVTVAVVIPTHNRVATIGAALASATRQSTPPSEIIVVDDGSTDGTAEVVRLFPQVMYVWQPRMERSVARNEGIRRARSEWIAFLDSDDWWAPTHLATCVSKIHTNVGLVYSGYSTVRDERTISLERNGKSGDVFADVAFERLPIIPSNTLIRRSALEEVSGFPRDLRISEDWVCFLKLAARWPFAFSGEVTVNLREHPGRSMRSAELVATDAPRALDLALEDEWVRRRLEPWLPTLRARRSLALATLLRSLHERTLARRLTWDAFLTWRGIITDLRFAKTLVRVHLPVAVDSWLTKAAGVARRMHLLPGR